MQSLFFIVALILLPFGNICHCQKETLKNTNKSIFGFKSDNDLYLPRHTDHYYTNGLEIGFYTTKPIFKNCMSQKINTSNGQNVFGIVLNAQMYTPSKIDNANTIEEDLQKVDRPYAGLLTLGLKREFNDPSVSLRMTTNFSLGILGPASQQGQIQRFFHAKFKRPIPNWDAQIPNDIALNLNIKIDKRILSLAQYGDIIGSISANAGTITNSVALGGLLRLGIFNDYFKGTLNQDREASLFFSPSVCFFYDQALLEGGVIARSKNYTRNTISRENMKHLYYEMSFGGTVNLGKVALTYSQNLRTPEFKMTQNMYWGSLSANVKI